MDKNQLMMLPNIEAEEIMFLQNVTKDLTADQDRNFFMIYQSRRKDPQTIMLVTILGFVVVAGIQRFMLNQIGMGLLYFFTGGLCLIGTIIDLINFKKMTFTYNQQMAMEALQICR
ncbi:MAG: TM2 domain-containing protein [Bacteroidia bacterium]|nr:TM2 domain-containing protein [Bacteroidia bacterium]HQV00637.1 TM2 domain-containing protein [Bacteroidia bacterium]